MTDFKWDYFDDTYDWLNGEVAVRKAVESPCEPLPARKVAGRSLVMDWGYRVSPSVLGVKTQTLVFRDKSTGREVGRMTGPYQHNLIARLWADGAPFMTYRGAGSE